MLRWIAPLSVALTCLVQNGEVFADVYKFVDSGGHVFYTDKPSHSGFRLILRSPPQVFNAVRGDRRNRASGLQSRDFPRTNFYHEQRRREFSPLINAAAYKYSLDPALLHAVIRAESGYNPEAVSNKGAAGLMQLMPATASRFGVRDRFDPQENIEGGARYLSELLNMFPSDLKLAVAAYNSGENTVRKFGNQVPPIEETQNYVSRVLNYYYR